MCLYKNQNVHKIAEQDIVCYKIVERTIDSGELESYYMDTSIKFEEPMMSFSHYAVMRDPTIIDDRCYLEEEVVHVFATSEFDSLYLDYLVYETNWLSKGEKEAVLIECIIPKGTIYVESIVCDMQKNRITANCYPQYGALCVIPKRIIRVL